MIRENEIRERLAALATNEISLEDFEGWIVSAAWGMHSDSSPEAVDLASSIHLLLSEYDHGDMNESELRRELLALRPLIVRRAVLPATNAVTVPSDWVLATGNSWETRRLRPALAALR
jgi:hypothetical protein